MQVQKPKQGYKLVKSLFDKYEEIPKDWEIISMRDAKIEIIDGDRGNEYPKEEDFSESGYCLFLTTKNVSKNGFLFDECLFISSQRDQKLRKGRISRGDIVITTRGTVGNIAYFDDSVPYDVIRINSGMAILRSNKFILQKFLYYVLKSQFMVKQLISFAYGSAQPQLTIALINSLKIIIPQSIQEQKKIVSILSNIDSLIEQTQNEIEQTQRLKKGLMQKLLTKGIGHTKFKKVKLLFGKDENIPEDWESKPVSEIAIVTMGQSPSGESYTRDDTGTPLLNGPTEFGPEYPTPIQFTSSPTKLCQENDILLCVRGSTTGRLNLADRTYCIGRGLAAISGLKNIANTKWLYYQYVNYQDDIYNIASGGGSTFPNINQDLIKKMLLPFPKFDEQQKIALHFSNIDSKIKKQQEYKSNLETLKKGLMQKLLTGQIRVKV